MHNIIHSPLPYGSRLWMVYIDGAELEVFSNGDCLHVEGTHSYDASGLYLWLQHQCVEFVRRYLYTRFGINFATVWSDGDAEHWFRNRKNMDLIQTDFDTVQSGDLITLQWGKWGHVAVVNSVTDTDIIITSQNFRNNEQDIFLAIPREILRWGEYILDCSKQEYIFESFLRYDPLGNS